jgi:hypothetical protein
MDEKFQLPVLYKGEELLLDASLLVTGFTHKFVVEVSEQEIIFEPDEERNYRAIIPYEDFGKEKPVDKQLLKAIAEAIETLVK